MSETTKPPWSRRRKTAVALISAGLIALAALGGFLYLNRPGPTNALNLPKPTFGFRLCQYGAVYLYGTENVTGKTFWLYARTPLTYTVIGQWPAGYAYHNATHFILGIGNYPFANQTLTLALGNAGGGLNASMPVTLQQRLVNATLTPQVSVPACSLWVPYPVHDPTPNNATPNPPPDGATHPCDRHHGWYHEDARHEDRDDDRGHESEDD